MSKWYKVKETIINEYLVEVEDDQDEEAAYEAVENVSLEAGDMMANLIDEADIENYIRFADSDKFILRNNSK